MNMTKILKATFFVGVLYRKHHHDNSVGVVKIHELVEQTAKKAIFITV